MSKAAKRAAQAAAAQALLNAQAAQPLDVVNGVIQPDAPASDVPAPASDVPPSTEAPVQDAASAPASDPLAEFGPQQPVDAPVPAGKRTTTMSAKDWLRQLFNAVNEAGEPVAYTLKELIALTGKTEVNIRTMLSDLRSPKYCGKDGVYNTKAVRVAGVTSYSKS